MKFWSLSDDLSRTHHLVLKCPIVYLTFQWMAQRCSLKTVCAVAELDPERLFMACGVWRAVEVGGEVRGVGHTLAIQPLYCHGCLEVFCWISEGSKHTRIICCSLKNEKNNNLWLGLGLFRLNLSKKKEMSSWYKFGCLRSTQMQLLNYFVPYFVRQYIWVIEVPLKAVSLCMPLLDANRDSYFPTGYDLFIRNEQRGFREWAAQIRWDQSYLTKC